MVSFTNLQQQTPKRLSVTINNTDLCIINAIRRIILAEIPTVAFYFDPTDIENNDIKITKNTCALHNEFLAHRISLVPLQFDENEINEFEAENYRFVLKKQNNSFETINVTTGDFEVYDKEGKKYPAEVVSKIFPKDPITKDHILLTKLKANLYDEHSPPRGEAVDIECVSSVNIAMKHARWAPVSQCSYNNTIDPELANKTFEVFLNKYEEETGRQVTPQEREKQLKRFNTLEVFRCFKKNKYDEADTFDFKIETETRLRPAYLFFKACKILIEKVDKFANNLRNNNEDAVKINKLTGVDDFYQVEVRNETFTLLNVLQSMMYNICFHETKPTNNPFEYIGYYQPHPLDDVMVIKIKLRKFDDVVLSNDYLASLLIDYSNTVMTRLKLFSKEWLQLVEKDIKDIKEVVDFKDTLA
jgi:DNA-directed RNA polymerase alpha subunit